MDKKRKIPKFHADKFLITFVLTSFIFSGCMMMAMHNKRSRTGMNPGNIQQVKVGPLVDQMVEEAVVDLSHKYLANQSIALWKIQSKTDGIDVEMIRQAIVVLKSRQRLR